MSTQNENLAFNPPRMMNVPQQPLPQTVQATLEHSGIPFSASEVVTDIPPDFNWMAQMQLYQGMFEYKNTQRPGDELDTWTVQNHQFGNGSMEMGRIIPWNYIPFVSCKYWVGSVSFKLIALKPPRVTGKLLIRYSFDPFEEFADDTMKRSICKEWDLGQSSECEFTVNAVNPLQARPTWLPRVIGKYYTGEKSGYIVSSQFQPLPTWHMGTIRVEAAQRLQVGSIFPDSIRILKFISYENCRFFMPTDPRGDGPHFLTKNTEDYASKNPGT